MAARKVRPIIVAVELPRKAAVLMCRNKWMSCVGIYDCAPNANEFYTNQARRAKHL